MSPRCLTPPVWPRTCHCSVAQPGLTLWGPTGCSTPGLPVLPCLSEFAQTCPTHQRCHPNISSSDAPFSSCPFLSQEFNPVQKEFGLHHGLLGGQGFGLPGVPDQAKSNNVVWNELWATWPLCIWGWRSPPGQPMTRSSTERRRPSQSSDCRRSGHVPGWPSSVRPSHAETGKVAQAWLRITRFPAAHRLPSSPGRRGSASVSEMNHELHSSQ